MHTFIIFLSITIGTLSGQYAHAANAKEILGKTQPGFSLPNLNDQIKSHLDWRGKTLVINFWATWCTPCLKEIPMFNRIQKEYAADGVQFIGIAIDNKDAINTFITRTPIDYPVLYGIKDTTQLTQKYGNNAGVLPYTVFVDSRGKIQRIAPGKLSEKYTRESIESML